MTHTDTRTATDSSSGTATDASLSWPRRRFVQGLALGGVLAAFPPLLQAGNGPGPGTTRLGSAPVLSGREIDLLIAQSEVNFTGNKRMATTINGSIPAPTLLLREGDEVKIRVTNRLAVPTSLHWHGIILPFQMDGVPGISFKGIMPGETFTYSFTVQQSGTYWYHSHSGFQEITGMYGAIVIIPRGGETLAPETIASETLAPETIASETLATETIAADRDYVVQLSDWTDEDPMHVFGKLKMQSDIYNLNRPTVGDFIDDVSRQGLGAALDKRSMWNRMRMNPTDLADVSAAVMTNLMNGTTPAGNWTGLFTPGERLRLRFINGASNSFYDVRIPGLAMTVVQADGQNIEPVTVDEFRFGPGETYDVLVTPSQEAYCIFAQSMDRSGYARGTLATTPGLSAPVPSLDAPEPLTMADMMGAMGGPGTDHSGMSMGDANMSMDHSGMNMGIDHSAMGHDMPQAMDHSQHGKPTAPLAIPSARVRHASSEYGPSVDMRVDMPRTNLDDPGIGLRNNGRRVLTLADLRTLGGIADKRPPTRVIELHLTGNMERYSWSIDGLEFGQSTPVHMRHGERLRVILQNDTMMTHPMHLHGMWSDLESDSGELLVRRHTIPVQPAQRISFLTTPNDLGRWAWHCHLLFHMDAGMFREVLVS